MILSVLIRKLPSYMLVRTGEMKRFDYTNDSEKAFIPYDMGENGTGWRTNLDGNPDG